jgi:hypothetical protein
MATASEGAGVRGQATGVFVPLVDFSVQILNEFTSVATD